MASTISVVAKGMWIGSALILCTSTMLSARSATTSVQYVSPLPDSHLVSPQTNIILRTIGTLDTALGSDSLLVFVYGSTTGRHTGRQTISDDNETIVFNPATPFAPGELVSVRLRSGIVTREGFTVNPFMFSFRVSPLTSDRLKQIRRSLQSAHASEDIGGAEPADTAALLHKDSLPADNLPAGFPDIKVVASNNPSPGNIFIGTFKILRSGSHFQFVQYVQSDKQYILMLDNAGHPVYYKKTPAMSTDFKAQSNGHPTYYDDAVSAFRELDTSMTPIAMYDAGNGYKTDVHAFKILPNGHAIFLCQEFLPVDMSTVVSGGNPNATVVGMVIQEVDKNKNVVFQWRTFDHFKITDAMHEDLTESMIDYVHSNTIEMDADGNILLSSRHMDEITKIDRNTGAIIWRLGGKNNQFTFINDTLRFSHQHSIRRTMTGSYILFDNGNFRTPEFSRAVEYTIDEKAKTATLIWQYRHTPDVFSVAMASVQRLANGNTLIGWGTSSSPAVTEVRPDGSTALELQLPDSVVSYRAFRSPWPMTTTAATSVKRVDEPVTYSLHQNFPNPFNPSTTIQFDLQTRSYVTLKVYDLLGREIVTLMDADKQAGRYTVPFNASSYSSGTYLAVLKVTVRDETGENVRTASRKMVLNK